jgi:hypothetical protein
MAPGGNSVNRPARFYAALLLAILAALVGFYAITQGMGPT